MYVKLGNNCNIQKNAKIGLKYTKKCQKTIIGNNAVIRSGTVIYADVKIGNDFKTGHNALIREKTIMGDKVLVGTNTIIDGDVEIGNIVKLESNVYIPTHTKIGNYVFIGPGAVLTNDKYPLRLRDEYKPTGPIIEDSVSIGANATIMPGVRIGKGSFVASGAVVINDVPPWSLAIGIPAKIKPLPEELKHENRPKKW